MIDYNFIKDLEGNKFQAYIPKDKDGNIIGQSGVTIGCGIDLGNFGEVDELNISKSLKDKLEPYIGLRRDLAEQMLNDVPLKLSEKEVSQLNQAVIEHQTQYIKDLYNRDSSRDWDDVPDRAKTVITSVLHQYGSPDRVPKFWSYAITHNWTNLIHELRDFGDDFPTRRNLEADYLENEYA